MKDFIDLPDREICSTALEANHQLWWKIGGVEYGSKDGLMPPAHDKGVYASLLAASPRVTTKVLPEEDTESVESLKTELAKSKALLAKSNVDLHKAIEDQGRSYRRGVEFERARHETMGVVTNTGKLTWEEVQAARADGKLYVSDDNLGSVPTEWLTQYRMTQTTKSDETPSTTFFGVLGAAALLGGLLGKKSLSTSTRVGSAPAIATSDEVVEEMNSDAMEQKHGST